MKKVTVLIPCYNEEQSLPALYERLCLLMDVHVEYVWEILFVNDGSRDNTLPVIKQLQFRDNRICFVDLSRNFGKEAAMLAGFKKGEIMFHREDHFHGHCLWNRGRHDEFDNRERFLL